ncbi:LGFP repeat-containing protein [Streptomyces sp. NPDC014983]|uniref:LGFP repeat-containing protein n=1 Tax=Streptomyces sp. NPDC014983 TaxID=3364933 RepID=UPI0036F9CB2A
MDGAIWTEYTQTPGVQRSLGCPTTDELGTPDGIGRFQAFDNGSIYWTPDTGAHAVWGAIRRHWADLGWERGYLGYPLTDEITNPDGYGVCQQFQGGTVYWSQYSGAHAVHGLTGWRWGQNGYESGFYGYPTSDEYKEDYVGGDEDNNTGVRQNFQSGRYILYSDGQSNAFESCHTACIGYGGITNTKWVKKTEVYMNLADQNKRSTHVTPTDAAFASTSRSETASSDSADNWKQVWSNTLMFPHATQGEMHSTYEQLYCHASYSPTPTAAAATGAVRPGTWKPGTTTWSPTTRAKRSRPDATGESDPGLTHVPMPEPAPGMGQDGRRPCGQGPGHGRDRSPAADGAGGRRVKDP